MTQLRRIPELEELEEWLHHPVTEAFLEFLRKWEESLQDQWAVGQFQVDSPQATAARNAGALGQVSMIRAIIGLEYERFREVLEDDERSEGENSMGPRGNG
jgi:hypothetical protein